jgi:hypothetical protein
LVTLKEIAYGAEVEVTGQTRETVARAVQSVVGGTVRHVGTPSCYDPWTVTAPDGRTWHVVADSSLTDSDEAHRAEVVTPILTWDDMPVLQEVVRAMRRAGCVASPSCGLHVHCDASRFTGADLRILAKQIHANEELIFHAFAVSDARRARYTKPLDPAFIARLERRCPRTREAFFRCWYGQAPSPTPQRYHDSRYVLANFHSVAYRNSIEYRAFSPGGLHAGKIKAAIVFSLALCARALNSRAATARRKPYDPTSAKYDMRVQLLHLGLIGPEWAHTRRHLLALMPGDAAYKRGRPHRKADPKTANATIETPRAEAETLRPSC